MLETSASLDLLLLPSSSNTMSILSPQDTSLEGSACPFAILSTTVTYLFKTSAGHCKVNISLSQFVADKYVLSRDSEYDSTFRRFSVNVRWWAYVLSNQSFDHRTLAASPVPCITSKKQFAGKSDLTKETSKLDKFQLDKLCCNKFCEYFMIKVNKSIG